MKGTRRATGLLALLIAMGACGRTTTGGSGSGSGGSSIGGASGTVGTGGSASASGGGSAGIGGAHSAGGGGQEAMGGQSGSAAAALVFQTQLDAAMVTWTSAQRDCPTYSYSRGFRSLFGSHSTTLVEVMNGRATRREYSFEGGSPLPDAGITTVWSETGAEIGTHANSTYGPFPASTVEELQTECAVILAKNPLLNYLNLVVDGRGVPTLCEFRPNNCVDDCTQGIAIGGFSCVPLAATDGGVN